MGWISTANLRANFRPARNATDAEAQTALDGATDEIAELVGQDAVADTLAVSPTDTIRAAKIVRAHSYLAVAFHCLNATNVKKTQSTESAGLGSNNVNLEVWNPKEMAEMSAQWRSKALGALGAYLLVDVAGDEYGDAPEFAEGVELEDCCYATCN